MTAVRKSARTRNRRIGIFDSGFGGLNIMRAIVRELPEYDYVYLGDTARVPYGSRSKETVYEFTKQAIDFFAKNKCDLIVLACNTASSDALRRIQQEYLPRTYPRKKVLGVLIPVVESAARKTRNKRVGVIATEGTVASGAFPREFSKIDPSIAVFQEACPLLVPFIEAGEHRSKAAELVLARYLAGVTKQGIDTLVLGCTHYGILERAIKAIVGPGVMIVSEGNIVAKKLASYLRRHPEIEEWLTKAGMRRFYSTDLTERFDARGSEFFGHPIRARKARIEI